MPLIDDDFAARLTSVVCAARDRRFVARFRQQRDTGMRSRGDHRLFQDTETGELYWARQIEGVSSNWIMRDVHHPWCTTGYAPTTFSTGRMQRCDCPVEAVKTGEMLAVYPRDV